MPSITPSVAVALITTPLGASAAAWWWALFTASSSAPTILWSCVPLATLTVWPGSLRGLGCSWASASATDSGICWISLPPSTTCSSCWPPQMPSTGLLAASAPSVTPTAQAPRPDPIVQRRRLQAAPAGALGEVPIGALIVGPGGGVLAEAGNRTEADRDPTAHAELVAIRAAAARLGAPRLVECDLYVTLEPCPLFAHPIPFPPLPPLSSPAPHPQR